MPRSCDKTPPFDITAKPKRPKPTYPTAIKILFDPRTGEVVGYKKITEDNKKEE